MRDATAAAAAAWRNVTWHVLAVVHDLLRRSHLSFAVQVRIGDRFDEEAARRCPDVSHLLSIKYYAIRE